MEWTAPKFEEVALNCEINSYASAALQSSAEMHTQNPGLATGTVSPSGIAVCKGVRAK